jgi:hypothetical protein
MGREVFSVRDSFVAWKGVIETLERGDVMTTRQYFDEAWRRALSAGAVPAEDADRVQFRFSAPEIEPVRGL